MNKKEVHILLVDDDADCLFQVGLLLSNRGFQVTSLESQKEAEIWIDSNKPDLAVFDLMMEREDSGFILSRYIKRKYPDVPVVILTAVTPETGITFDLQSEESRRWIKADLYLEKGVNREILSNQIAHLIP